MPRVELHWRVHWYEDRFAADALEPAERPVARAPLRMLPADGLATLTLIYARDGLSGLRTPADIAAWWDTRCAGEDLDALIDSIVATIPRSKRRCGWGQPRSGPWWASSGPRSSRSREDIRLESNVKSHLTSAFGKLGVSSRNAAAELILDHESGLGPGILRISPEE
ncbi:MAG: hypothetical protein ACXVXL_20250 [Solirubrobacteraceae bacterium]